MAEAFLGEIRMFAGNFAPRGWAFCEGQLLPIAENTALFAILGTTYGGNGQSNFALPDFRSRSPVGVGQNGALTPIRLGDLSGSEQVTLMPSQLPRHAPEVTVNVAIPAVATSTTAVATPAANLNLGPIAAGGRDGSLYTADATNVTLKPFAAEVTSKEVGNNSPIPIRNPYVGMNFIISLDGIFPTRN